MASINQTQDYNFPPHLINLIRSHNFDNYKQIMLNQKNLFNPHSINVSPSQDLCVSLAAGTLLYRYDDKSIFLASPTSTRTFQQYKTPFFFSSKKGALCYNDGSHIVDRPDLSLNSGSLTETDTSYNIHQDITSMPMYESILAINKPDVDKNRCGINKYRVKNPLNILNFSNYENTQEFISFIYSIVNEHERLIVLDLAVILGVNIIYGEQNIILSRALVLEYLKSDRFDVLFKDYGRDIIHIRDDYDELPQNNFRRISYSILDLYVFNSFINLLRKLEEHIRTLITGKFNCDGNFLKELSGFYVPWCTSAFINCKNIVTIYGIFPEEFILSDGDIKIKNVSNTKKSKKTNAETESQNNEKIHNKFVTYLGSTEIYKHDGTKNADADDAAVAAATNVEDEAGAAAAATATNMTDEAVSMDMSGGTISEIVGNYRLMSYNNLNINSEDYTTISPFYTNMDNRENPRLCLTECYIMLYNYGIKKLLEMMNNSFNFLESTLDLTNYDSGGKYNDFFHKLYDTNYFTDIVEHEKQNHIMCVEVIKHLNNNTYLKLCMCKHFANLCSDFFKFTPEYIPHDDATFAAFIAKFTETFIGTHINETNGANTYSLKNEDIYIFSALSDFIRSSTKFVDKMINLYIKNTSDDTDKYSCVSSGGILSDIYAPKQFSRLTKDIDLKVISKTAKLYNNDQHLMTNLFQCEYESICETYIIFFVTNSLKSLYHNYGASRLHNYSYYLYRRLYSYPFDNHIHKTLCINISEYFYYSGLSSWTGYSNDKLSITPFLKLEKIYNTLNNITDSADTSFMAQFETLYNNDVSRQSDNRTFVDNIIALLDSLTRKKMFVDDGKKHGIIDTPEFKQAKSNINNEINNLSDKFTEICIKYIRGVPELGYYTKHILWTAGKRPYAGLGDITKDDDDILDKSQIFAVGDLISLYLTHYNYKREFKNYGIIDISTDDDYTCQLNFTSKSGIIYGSYLMLNDLNYAPFDYYIYETIKLYKICKSAYPHADRFPIKNIFDKCSPHQENKAKKAAKYMNRYEQVNNYCKYLVTPDQTGLPPMYYILQQYYSSLEQHQLNHVRVVQHVRAFKDKYNNFMKNTQLRPIDAFYETLMETIDGKVFKSSTKSKIEDPDINIKILSYINKSRLFSLAVYQYVNNMNISTHQYYYLGAGRRKSIKKYKRHNKYHN